MSVDGGESRPTTFSARAHHEFDVEYFPSAVPGTTTAFWEKWFWQSLQVGETFSTAFDAPGAAAGQPARLRARLFGLRRVNGRNNFV